MGKKWEEGGFATLCFFCFRNIKATGHRPFFSVSAFFFESAKTPDVVEGQSGYSPCVFTIQLVKKRFDRLARLPPSFRD